MRDNVLSLAITVLLILSTGNAYAEDAKSTNGPKVAEEKKLPFSGALSFGYGETQGNSETISWTGSGSLKYDDEHILNILYISSAHGESFGVKYEEQLLGFDRFEVKTQFKRMMFFLDFYYYENKFEGYDYKKATGPGIGYNLVKKDNLKFQAYYAYYFSREKKAFGPATEENKNYHVVGQILEYKLTEGTTITQKYDYYQRVKNADEYIATWSVSLTTKIWKAISMQVNYKSKYESVPIVPSLKKHDTSLYTSLVISF